MRTRTYVKVGLESEESVTVHIDDQNRVRMTADNIHGLLTHLGFMPVDQKEHA